MQIISLLHQGPARHRGVDFRPKEPLVPPPDYLNHGHRHARHHRINHMAMHEDVGRYLSPGEFLPARDLLDPGHFCQAVYGPEHSLCAQVSGALAREEPHLGQVCRLSQMACKVPWLTRAARE